MAAREFKRTDWGGGIRISHVYCGRAGVASGMEKGVEKGKTFLL